MTTGEQFDSAIVGTPIQPRPYQRTISCKTVDMFSGRYKTGDGATERAMRSVLIESPTGSGKTVMGMVTATMLANEHPDLVVGWVAMRRDLLRQAAKANADLGLNVPINFCSMFDKHPDALVAARQSGKTILLVVDEAQHDSANSMAHLHNLIKPDMTLGLTATPFRTDCVKLCFDKVVRDAGIHALIQDGYLSRFDHYNLPEWSVETVADHYCATPERWGRSVFYFLTKDDCRALRNKLCKAGHFERWQKACRDNDELGMKTLDPIVDGDSDRERQLPAYLNNETDKLINCMVLTEGFDDPSMQTVWVRDSSKGPTMQMCGRVFRQFPDLERKQVVQSSKTKWPITRTALPEQQYIWEGEQWRSLTVNSKMNEISNRSRAVIASTPVEMPKFLAGTKSRRRIRF